MLNQHLNFTPTILNVTLYPCIDTPRRQRPTPNCNKLNLPTQPMLVNLSILPLLNSPSNLPKLHSQSQSHYPTFTTPTHTPPTMQESFAKDTRSIKGAPETNMTRTTLQQAKGVQDLGISIEILPLNRPG